MIKVKDLIERLQEFDQDKWVKIVELGDFYETYLISITEYEKEVHVNVKNTAKENTKTDYEQ